MATTKLSKLMQLSWEIQTRHSFMLQQKIEKYNQRRSIRSLALETAWSIAKTEEITIHHLVKRYSHEHNKNRVNPKALSLFSNTEK
jgi:D-hexose-6-phosphate mutarotase